MAKAELNKKTSELTVKVVADKKVWKEQQEKAFKEIGKNVEIKGFRKGSVPADVLKKHVSQQEVMQKAVTKMLDILVREAAKDVDDKYLVLEAPTYNVEKISDAELEVAFIYPVYPDIKLADYKSLDVKYVAPKFDKKIVKDEIEKIRKMKATLETKDGALAKGDTAVFDFAGSVDGKLFDGGSAKGHQLEIGSGQFIPGFEDQMVGMKVGDKKDVKVTFPKEYHSEELKGKDAVFAVELHEVKTAKLPEVNDEFAKSVGAPNVATVAKLEEYIEKVFKEQMEQKAIVDFHNQAFTILAEKTELPVPMQLIGREMQNQEKRFEEEIKQQGLTIDKYIELTGIKKEALYSQFKKQAEMKLKESLIFAEIAKAEKIELTDADYDEEYKKLARVYGKTEDEIKGLITKQQMQIPMTNDRVVQALMKYNK